MHRDPRVRDVLVRTRVQYRRLSERKTLLSKKKSRSQRGVKKILAAVMVAMVIVAAVMVAIEW